MPLLIAVVVGLVVFVLRRALFGRRLTIEQSVDRHRRTLSAVHDAASRDRADDARPGSVEAARPLKKPVAKRSRRPSIAPRARWQLVIALMTVATVVTVAIVITQSRDEGTDRSVEPTTTRPRATNPTTTTRPAPTTTVALVTRGDASGTAFTIAKPTYTLVVQGTAGDCWIDARDPAGSSLFSGVVTSGQSQSITAGAITLRLGNPAAVTLSIEGKPVPFPLSNGSPVTLHFTGSSTPT